MIDLLKQLGMYTWTWLRNFNVCYRSSLFKWVTVKYTNSNTCKLTVDGGTETGEEVAIQIALR